jgi:hypothetical protein
MGEKWVKNAFGGSNLLWIMHFFYATGLGFRK